MTTSDRLARLVSFAALAACLLGSASAQAAPVPLSAIPLGSDAMTPAHGTVRLDDVKSVKDAIITAMDKPVCIRSSQADIGSGFGWFSGDAKESLVVERLVEGDEPALEGTLVEPQTVALASATLLGRSRVRLVRIDTGTELPVYAYRTAKAVHLLARRGFNTPNDGFDPDPRMGVRTACGFWHVVLENKEDSAGATLAMAHAMSARARWVSDFEDLAEYDKTKAAPADEPVFMLNASLSKVSRDPEPILSVSVRALPRRDVP